MKNKEKNAYFDDEDLDNEELDNGDFDNDSESDVESLSDDLTFLDDDLDETLDGVVYEKELNDELEDEDDDSDIMVKFNTNNHKQEGKHSLSRDTIFKGKLDDVSDMQEYDYSTNQHEDFNLNDGLPIETGSAYEFESKHNELYVDRLNLARDVYDLLKENTELDFSANRRKPNKQMFNDYYRMLLNNIGKEYTKSEIFVELSYYFTDNIFNMFKLLDKEYATRVIMELKQQGHLTNLNNINFI